MSYPTAGWKPSGSLTKPKRQYIRGGQHGHPGSRKPGCPECRDYYRQWRQKRKAAA